MTKGGKKVGQAAAGPKVVATVGLVSCSGGIGVGYSSCKIRKVGGETGKSSQEVGYERISKTNHVDKSGGYERFTTKEKVSTGQVYKHNQVGLKNEFKKSSTVKVGNKRGYTEFYTEERVRDVSFSNANDTSSYSNRLTYGYDYDYDYDH